MHLPNKSLTHLPTYPQHALLLPTQPTCPHPPTQPTHLYLPTCTYLPNKSPTYLLTAAKILVTHLLCFAFLSMRGPGILFTIICILMPVHNILDSVKRLVKTTCKNIHLFCHENFKLFNYRHV